MLVIQSIWLSLAYFISTLTSVQPRSGCCSSTTLVNVSVEDELMPDLATHENYDFLFSSGFNRCMSRQQKQLLMSQIFSLFFFIVPYFFLLFSSISFSSLTRLLVCLEIILLLLHNLHLLPVSLISTLYHICFFVINIAS